LGAVATKEICCRLQNQGKIIAIGILILLLADAASAHLVYFQINHGNRPEWKSALTYVQARREPDDIVVSSVANVSSYYLNEEVMWLNEIDPKSITTSNKNYWFVIDSENGWWATPQKEWVEDHGQLIQVWYLRTKEDMHLRVYYFDPAESEP
jgi:hypothetical protein